ncbi:MAG: hypothetical protein RHS_0398 [Robinsoniella sp. RHS]|nr:MAG: hypothetical protein RHS_0398 [Robinsoniella sp. RHS]
MLPSAAGYLVCASLRSLPDERPLDVQQPSAVAKWFAIGARLARCSRE